MTLTSNIGSYRESTERRKTGIGRGFEEINSDTNAQLTAVVHPYFKLYWFNDEVQKTWLFDNIDVTNRCHDKE